MNDGIDLIVKKVECIEQLISPLQNSIGREGAAARFECVCEIFAGDEFHHQELDVLFKKMIGHSRQRDMLQTIQQTSFALDRSTIVVVHEQRFFYRDRAAESLIGGNINCTHSALPDLFIDAVTLL